MNSCVAHQTIGSSSNSDFVRHRHNAPAQQYTPAVQNYIKMKIRFENVDGNDRENVVESVFFAMTTKRDEGFSFLTKSNLRFNHLNFTPESVGEWPPYGNYKFDK